MLNGLYRKYIKKQQYNTYKYVKLHGSIHIQGKQTFQKSTLWIKHFLKQLINHLQFIYIYKGKQSRKPDLKKILIEP